MQAWIKIICLEKLIDYIAVILENWANDLKDLKDLGLIKIFCFDLGRRHRSDLRGSD